MPGDPDDTLIFAQPGELTTGEVVDGEFEALDHLGLAGTFTTQEAADETVFQSEGFQALVSDALSQQMPHLFDHALLHPLVDALIDASVELRTRPVDGE